MQIFTIMSSGINQCPVGKLVFPYIVFRVSVLIVLQFKLREILMFNDKTIFQLFQIL